MGMLPIFVIGMIIGGLSSYAYYSYKKDTPSEIQIQILEKQIEMHERDNDKLVKLVESLYEEIRILEDELKNK